MYLIGTVTFSWTSMTIKFLLIIRIIRHCNIKVVLYTYVCRFQYGFLIALLRLCNNTWVISNISTHIFYESIIEIYGYVERKIYIGINQISMPFDFISFSAYVNVISSLFTVWITYIQTREINFESFQLNDNKNKLTLKHQTNKTSQQSTFQICSF